MRLRPMSVRFGISATPMREALLRLVSEKALALDARGTVAVPTLTLDQLLEIRTIRTDLEGRAAAAAAKIVSDSDIDALANIHTQMALCHKLKQFEKAIDLNTEFHLYLCRLGRLPVLYDLVGTLGPLRADPFASLRWRSAGGLGLACSPADSHRPPQSRSRRRASGNLRRYYKRRTGTSCACGRQQRRHRPTRPLNMS